MSYTILIVEDDEGLNRGISLKLRKENYTVLSAADIREAHSHFQIHHIDLIICDITLPDGSGLDFCTDIRKNSRVLFLFLTALDTELDIINGYDAGADDYVTKPFNLMILISKVRAMLGRLDRRTESEKILSSGDIKAYLDEMRLTKSGCAVTLSPTEWKLLLSLMEHPRRILSKRQLLEAIWDSGGQYVDDNTVAVNIRRLREKIEDDPSNPVYLRNVRGMGYIWDLECATV